MNKLTFYKVRKWLLIIKKKHNFAKIQIKLYVFSQFQIKLLVLLYFNLRNKYFLNADKLLKKDKIYIKKLKKQTSCPT